MAAHKPFQSILSAFYAAVMGFTIFAAVIYDYIYKYSSHAPFNFDATFNFMDHIYQIDVRYIAYALLSVFALSLIGSIGRHLKQYKARDYGVKTEDKWFKVLKQGSPSGFSVWKDIFFFRGIGDVDALISYNRKVYLIEIKSHFAVSINDSKTGILDKNKNKFKKDFIKQAFDLSQAYYHKNKVTNTPILWFPNSKGNPVCINNVIIVRGNDGKLFNTIKYIDRN